MEENVGCLQQSANLKHNASSVESIGNVILLTVVLKSLELDL